MDSRAAITTSSQRPQPVPASLSSSPSVTSPTPQSSSCLSQSSAPCHSETQSHLQSTANHIMNHIKLTARRKVVKRSNFKKNPSSSDSETCALLYTMQPFSNSASELLPPPTPLLSGAEWTLGIPGFTPLPDLFSKVELDNFIAMPPRDAEISIADFYVSFPSVSSVKMEVTKTNADEINAARQPDAQVPSVQSASGSNIQSATTIQLPIIRRNSQDPTNGPTNLHDEEDTPSKPLPTPTPSPMKPRWASGSTKAAATAASVIAAAASAAVAVAAAAAVAASLMSSENSSVSSQSSSSQPPESPSKRRGRPSSSKYVPKHTFQLQKPAVSLFSVIAPSSTPARYPTSASSETEHDLQSDSDVVPMKDEICTEKESPNTDIAENQGRPMTTRAADSNSAKPLIRAASASDSSTASVTVSDTFNDEAVWRTEAKTTSHQVRIPFGSNSAVSPVKVRRQNALTAKSRKLTDAVALLKAQRRAEAEGLTTLLKSRVGVLGNYGAELRRFVVGSGDGANGEDGEHDGYENVHGDRMDVLEDEWGNQYDGDHSTAEEGLADRPVETSDLKNPVQSSAQSDREKRKRSAHSLNESDSGKRARRGVPRNNDTESAAQPSRKKQRTANSASRNTAAVDPFPAFSSVPKYGRRRTSIGGGDSTAATLDLTVLLSTAVELLNETDPTSKITAQPVLIGAATKKRTASDLSASEEGNDSQPRSSGLDLLALLAADGLF